jgi:hypothetical protein
MLQVFPESNVNRSIGVEAALVFKHSFLSWSNIIYSTDSDVLVLVAAIVNEDFEKALNFVYFWRSFR